MWNRCSVFCVLALIFSAQMGTAQAAPVPREGALAWRTVPSEMCRGLWIVPLRFEGQPGGVLRLVLDTGASGTSIDPDAIQRVFGRRVRAGRKVRLKRLEAGPLKIRSVRVRAHEMDHLSRALGTEMDGILGFPVFKDLLLALDYGQREIRVARGELPEVDGARVFSDIGTLRPYLPLEVGDRELPILIDSGSTGWLTLRETDPVPWQVEPKPFSAAVRYRGIRLERTGRAAGTYSFGPSRLETPLVDLMEEGTRLAGYRILRRSVWEFDTRNRRLRITPLDSSRIEPVPETGIGVALRPLAAGVEVVKVFPKTPGARAGLRQGDVLVEVDGTPIYERGCRSFSDDAPGTRRQLTVVRNSERMTVEVVAEVLVP